LQRAGFQNLGDRHSLLAKEILSTLADAARKALQRIEKLLESERRVDAKSGLVGTFQLYHSR
jgi:hypothetical protein